MQPHRQTWRQALYLNQEEYHEDQEQGLEGLEGDAPHVSEKQETLQEEIPSEKPCRDSGIDCQEEVQPHALLEEEERPEERAQAEGIDVQPVNHSQIAFQIRVVCQSLHT